MVSGVQRNVVHELGGTLVVAVVVVVAVGVAVVAFAAVVVVVDSDVTYDGKVKPVAEQ